VLSPSRPDDPLDVASKAVLYKCLGQKAFGLGWEISEASVDEGKQNVSNALSE
jgi:hypothetical protein